MVLNNVHNVDDTNSNKLLVEHINHCMFAKLYYIPTSNTLNIKMDKSISYLQFNCSDVNLSAEIVNDESFMPLQNKTNPTLA